MPFTPRTLRELAATLLALDTARGVWLEVDSLAGADGVMLLCPQCYDDPPVGPVGVHRVICWGPHVGQEHTPRPGRWRLVGTSLDDLSLVAGSSSVHVQGGCGAHFLVERGRVTPC